MNLNKIGIISGILTCLNALLIVFLLQLLPLCSEIWSYFYIFIIMLIIQNILIHQIFDIEDNDVLQKAINLIHTFLLASGAIVFIYIFFTGFYHLQKISFEPVYNCQITGEMFKSLQGSEFYSILYTSFEYNGQKMLGYSCKSNNFQASYYGTQPRPFSFIKQNEYYLCKNPIGNNQTSYDVQPQKIGKTTNRQRIYGGFYHPNLAYPITGKGEQKGCRPYDFSNVKLASWLCMDFNIDYQQMIKPQKCYVNFYNNQEKAFENAQQFRDLRKINNFAMQNMNTINQFNDNKIYLVLKILMVLQWIVVVLDYKILNYFLKPSVVGIMCFYTLTLQANEKSNYKYIMAAGFFFSVGGDTLLLIENLDFFLYGLISFALSHICFIIAYLQSVQLNLKKLLKITLPLTILNLVVGKFMFSYLTNLPNFQQFMVTPLAVYIVLISLHAIIASARVKTSFKSYTYALIGGYFFIASDSILSLNIFAGFNHPIVLFLIMFTYYISEYFILISTVYHLSYEITQEKIQISKMQKGTQNAPKSSLSQQTKPQMPKHNMTVVELQTPHMKIPGVQKYSHDELKLMLEKAKQNPAVHEGFYLKVQNYDFQVDEWELETGNCQPHTDESKLNMRPKTAVTADQRRIELAKKSQQARQQMQEKYEKEQNPTFKRPTTAKVASKKKIESVKESKQQSNNIIENEPEVNSEHEDNQEQQQEQENDQENNQENQEEAEEQQDAEQQNVDEEEEEQNEIKSKQTSTKSIAENSKKQQSQKLGKEKTNSKTQIKNQEIDQQEEDEEDNSYKIQKISKEKQKQNLKKNLQMEDEMGDQFDEDDFNNQIEQFSISQAFNQSNYSQMSKGKQKQSVKPKGPYKSDVANMMSSMFSEISGFDTDI
ncbi:hypothetical protein ABPG74_009687 [Tetrahymena malaccensis]